MIDTGEVALGGRVPVNVSGGLLSKGHPLGATGIANIYEICTHLRGEAEKRQVKGARIGHDPRDRPRQRLRDPHPREGELAEATTQASGARPARYPARRERAPAARSRPRCRRRSPPGSRRRLARRSARNARSRPSKAPTLDGRRLSVAELLGRRLLVVFFTPGQAGRRAPRRGGRGARAGARPGELRDPRRRRRRRRDRPRAPSPSTSRCCATRAASSGAGSGCAAPPPPCSSIPRATSCGAASCSPLEGSEPAKLVEARAARLAAPPRTPRAPGRIWRRVRPRRTSPPSPSPAGRRCASRRCAAGRRC